MFTCPNCGQKTEGDTCQWCHYPILKGKPVRQDRSYPIIMGRPLRQRETNKQIEREVPEAKKAKQLAKEEARKARQIAKERAKKETKELKAAKQLAREQAQREAEEIVEAPIKTIEQDEIEVRKVEEIKPPVVETFSELDEGVVELVFPPPVNLNQVKQVEESLKQIEYLRLVRSGGSAEEGAVIAVSVQKLFVLISILNEMLLVEQVVEVEKKRQKLTVRLKAPVE